MWFTNFNHKEQTSMMEYVVHELHVFLSYPTSSGSTPFLTSEFQTHQYDEKPKAERKGIGVCVDANVEVKQSRLNQIGL